MAYLNEKNEITEKKIHLLVTIFCDRNCPDCCNNQYDMTTIPVVTEEELRNAEEIYLTGGEPFAYADPCRIAWRLKKDYLNIKKVFVYTNATELAFYIAKKQTLFTLSSFNDLDGLTVSIKDEKDRWYFDYIVKIKEINELESNILYVFPNIPGCDHFDNLGNFIKKDRYWQKDFTPAPDSIFRRI